MGTFTVLDATELATLAASFGLGALRSSRAIAAGTINSNFAIETEHGTFFLRINEGKAEADVAWEARLVTLLAQQQVPTPPPLVARDGRPYAELRRDGESKWVSAFPWRPGHHLDADAVTVAHADALGAALATLHVAGLAIEIEPRVSIYDHAHLVRRFERQVAPSTDPMLADAQHVLREELAFAEAAADIRRAATHGIIHGDLFRDNVLWDGDRVTALLDFEQASRGSFVYDLAVCINDWCWTEHAEQHGGDGAGTGHGRGEPRLDLAQALLRGYQRVRPLTAADRHAFGVEVRAAAARFTLTRVTDVYLAKVANPEKDFRAFLARCHAWRSEALRALSHLV